MKKTLLEFIKDYYGEDENITESVTRQFRRYGNKFVRQYRCMSGPKKGRLVKNAVDCGRRKDPRKVRQGKYSSRIKRKQRTRKSNRTKRKPISQMLSRRNDVLRGDK